MGQTTSTAHQGAKLQRYFSISITSLFFLSALNVYLHKLLGTGMSDQQSQSSEILKPHQAWYKINDKLCDLNIKTL